MSAPLTEEEFSKHLNTKFRVKNVEPIELELTGIKGYLSKPNEETGMERFSAYFLGSGDHYLRQSVYVLDHDVMGEFELFLVPISQDERGYQYEAVFNYFREKSVD